MTDSITRPTVEETPSDGSPTAENASTGDETSTGGKPSRVEPIGPDIAEVLAAVEQASGRRRWPWLVGGAVVGAAAALGVSTLLADDGGEATATPDSIELATAEVEQRDLSEEIEWDGTLGYGEPVAVTGSGGVVTATAAVGDPIDRGDVVAAVDGTPLPVFFGSLPMWRTLSDGSIGPDVRQLETNLAMLGYDPDATVDIDDTFTANTEAMVERWQEDLGSEITGVVNPGEVIVVGGPSTLTSIADVGASASGPLLTLAPRGLVADVVADMDGVISELIPVGSTLVPGQVAYRVDEVPVLAIDPSDPVAVVLLSETFTELELEEALAAAGHDPDDEMTVDGIVTDATVAAVERWQTAVGLPVSGSAEPGHYLAADPEGAVVQPVVSEHRVADGDFVVTGGPILTTSASLLSVVMTVDVADADEFELGQEVAIELADERVVSGSVTIIGAVATAADPQGSPSVDITIGLTTDDQAPVEGPVTVVSVGEEIVDATVVPTRALVALAEGGFAVERVDGTDGATTLVGVELGAFDDGMVEVVEGDLAPGDRLVVPS